MATKEDTLLLLHEIYALITLSHDAYDGTSDPRHPRAPAEHYDALARAIVTLARIHPDPEFVIRLLAGQLPAIEGCGHVRYMTVMADLGYPEDPEVEAILALPKEEQDAHLAAVWQQIAELKKNLLSGA